jgi:hypothetical protein
LQVFLSRGRLKAGGGIMDAGIIKHAAAAGLKTGYLMWKCKTIARLANAQIFHGRIRMIFGTSWQSRPAHESH